MGVVLKERDEILRAGRDSHSRCPHHHEHGLLGNSQMGTCDNESGLLGYRGERAPHDELELLGDCG
jgi:hypothetical protein